MGLQQINSSASLSNNELLQLHDLLCELEKRPGWKRRCFFARLMLATGMKLREALPVSFQDILLDYIPPVIFVKNHYQGREKSMYPGEFAVDRSR